MKKLIFTLFSVFVLFSSCTKDSPPPERTEFLNFGNRKVTVDPATGNNIQVMKMFLTKPGIILDEKNLFFENTDGLISFKAEYSGETATFTTVSPPVTETTIAYYTFSYINQMGIVNTYRAPIVMIRP